VVLYQYHANAWAGAILTVVGILYTWIYAPSRGR